MIGLLIGVGVISYAVQLISLGVLLADDGIDDSKTFLALLTPFGFIYILMKKYDSIRKDEIRVTTGSRKAARILGDRVL